MPAAYTDASSVQTLGFGDIGPLTRRARLVCGCCSSGQRFAMGFLPTDASRRRSCPSAGPSLCRVVNRLTSLLAMFTVKQVRPAGRTDKKARVAVDAGLDPISLQPYCTQQGHDSLLLQSGQQPSTALALTLLVPTTA